MVTELNAGSREEIWFGNKCKSERILTCSRGWNVNSESTV